MATTHAFDPCRITDAAGIEAAYAMTNLHHWPETRCVISHGAFYDPSLLEFYTQADPQPGDVPIARWDREAARNLR